MKVGGTRYCRKFTLPEHNLFLTGENLGRCSLNLPHCKYVITQEATKKNTMKLERLLQRHNNTIYKDNNPKLKSNMDTTHTTYNDTTAYCHSKRITDGKTQKKKMQKELKTRTVKIDPELYEYAAYAGSEWTVQGKTEKCDPQIYTY